MEEWRRWRNSGAVWAAKEGPEGAEKKETGSLVSSNAFRSSGSCTG